MGNSIRAQRGDVLVESISGPASYPSGGFSQRVDLGRVDEADVGMDSLDRFAVVNAVNDNNAVVIQAGSYGSGGEVAAGTDLSGDTFRLEAFKE